MGKRAFFFLGLIPRGRHSDGVMDELFSKKVFESAQMDYCKSPPKFVFLGLAGWTLEILISG
ncbi:MAG: hypothetical protein DWI24_01860 [Planctomycetota bacterium]|nr:MAG: hypothetical protein DWI24_01860 [Planctomycetota bacterium]